MLERVGGNEFDNLWSTLAANSGTLFAIGAVISIILLARKLAASLFAYDYDEGRGGGIAGIIVRAFTTNWQLTLLATTAFVLSVASGWTTWDGMKNFTGEPLLSLMITFGIQGVMLIIAWLIGESFAAGLNRRSQARSGRHDGGIWRNVEPLIGLLVGTLLTVGLLTAIANAVGAFDDYRAAASGQTTWSGFANKALYLGVGLLVLATLLINQKSEILQPYVQSARVIAKNAVLWVMFLSCMATSVFFSFDSLFSSIFPLDQRKRAADIRSARQVAGVVNDIGALAALRQSEEAKLLFQAPGWLEFEKNLSALSRASQGAEQEIERYFVEKMEERRRAIAEQQERISTAKSGQAGLVSRKQQLTDEMSRMKAERPALVADVAEKKNELANRAKLIDLKRVEVMAEERGAEGSLKAGRGPIYRQRKAELDQMQDAYKIQEERVRDANRRMSSADTRIAQIGRELATIDADIAKLKGEADTAAQRISVAETTKNTEEDGPKVDPARVRVAFERAHTDFRQQPTVERLGKLATQCGQLLGAMTSTPATKELVRGIDCDPKQATDAATRVFALNAGLTTFARQCAGGQALPKTGGTDALLAFGRKCLQDSGLPSRDLDQMAEKISGIDLNRDDKAHRFVVTWNAFTDGNRLAYLALAIAIAIDSLVFMSGLFGANAIRSPLTEIEDRGEMTADQLEATIDATLGETPHPRATLARLLAGLHPVPNDDGFASEIILDEHDPLVEEMRKVLVAGGIIGAVRRVGHDRGRYLVHSGLARYLAIAQRKPWKVKSAEVDKKELVNVVGVALLPDPMTNAETVLSYLHPISDSERFSAEVYPWKDILEEAHRRLVLNTLGAGATIPGAVERENDNGRYLVSTDFYKTLLMMRAAAIPAFRPDVVRARYAQHQLPSPEQGPGPETPPTALHSSPVPKQELPQDELKQITHAPEVREPDGPAAEERDSGNSGRPQGPKAASGQHEPVLGAVANDVRPRQPGSGPEAALHEQALPAPQRPAARKPTTSSRLSQDIRRRLVEVALKSWGPWSPEDSETIWQADSQPLYEAISRLINREPQLSDRLREQGAWIEQEIRGGGQELKKFYSNDGQVLESEVVRLCRQIPIIMTMPDGPYVKTIEELIAELKERGATLEDQAGNGHLSRTEIQLFQALVAHAHDFRELDRAIDREERLVQLIDAFGSGARSNMEGQQSNAPLT